MQSTGQTIFATAIYCYINLETKQLIYAQAGARHGVYLPSACQRGASTFNDDSIHPALGLIPETRYTDEVLNLDKGDTVVLYTDGIVEAARDEEEYSEARMVQFLMQQRQSGLSDMLQRLLVSVGDFTQCKELEDDVCLVALRVV
ncbi:MAG: serine/threonine-protein phosphatase [Puniceicoccaceae bacterium]|nr:MAG: serine/threonine-protein phosphatase [Puniceicoccaceae bacterium]